MINFLIQNKKLKYNLYNIFLILIFMIPLIVYGLDDMEEYTFGLYSSQIILKNFSNPFIHFIDEIGAGSRFPIGHGTFFHPINLFLFNKKLFYIIFIFLHLSIQIIFFNRILKFYFKDNYNKYLSSLLILFCIPNYNYIYSDEWLSIFFSYSFIFVIFYYLINFIQTSCKKKFIKLLFFTAFWIINGHIGYQVCAFLIFFITILISLNKIKFSKEIFFLVILSILLVLDRFYFLLIETNNFDATRRAPMDGYDTMDWIVGAFFPILQFFDSYIQNFLSKNPDFWIIFTQDLKLNLTSLYRHAAQNAWQSDKFTYSAITGIHFAIMVIILPFIKFWKLNKSILFFGIISVFFTLDGLYGKFFGDNVYYSKISQIFSAKWFFRDLAIIFGSIIFVQLFRYIKSRVFKFIIFFLILYVGSSIYVKSFNEFITDKNNFIVNKIEKSPLKESLNFQKKSTELNRISISERAMGVRSMRNLYRDQGIFSLYDLNNYGLRPFQVWTKNISHKEFNKEKTLLYGNIYPNNKLLGNNFFLNLFHIKYILLTKSELAFIKDSEYKILSKIKTKKKDLILIERDINTVLLKSENVNIFNSDMEECMKKDLSLLECALKFEKYFINIDKENFFFERKKLNNYQIKSNIDTNDLWIFPFKFDDNWKSDTQIKNLSNFLIGLKLNKDKKVNIYYFNKVRFILDVISISALLIMLYFFLRKIKF